MLSSLRNSHANVNETPSISNLTEHTNNSERNVCLVVHNNLPGNTNSNMQEPVPCSIMNNSRERNHKQKSLSDFQKRDPYNDNIVFTNENKFWLAIWVTLARCPDVPKHLFEDIRKVIMDYQEYFFRISSSASSRTERLFTPPTLKELVKDMATMLHMKESKPTVVWCLYPLVGISSALLFSSVVTKYIC